MTYSSVHLSIFLLSLILVDLLCSFPSTVSVPTAVDTPYVGITRQRTAQAHRILIRQSNGTGEFFDTLTGEKFIPRGVNYLDFYKNEHDNYEDRTMAIGIYDPMRVRAAFRHLKEKGYNTVRIFFDLCGTGPICVARSSGAGLNPGYLDNMVDLMWIADEQQIHIVFTANALPDGGGYWQIFDAEFNRTVHSGFESAQNADWIHSAGVKAKAAFWRDLMSGLAERDAPFPTVLGWELTNEFWLWKNVAPLSLSSGKVTISNGKTYDMADPASKQLMVTDGTLFFMNTIIPIIKQFDPAAQTTMGFFVPQYPNPTFIGGDWYVDTAPLMEQAPIDFWDFHSYADTDLTVIQQAENFGMPGHDDKPVLMGETGVGHETVPSLQTAVTQVTQWIANSCKVGFDGWLYWGYYPWPADLEGKPWAPLEEAELILNTLSPVNRPDPCISS